MVSLGREMSSPSATKTRKPDAKSVEALRRWLASPKGRQRMAQAARDAEKARAEIETQARVSGDVLRARVTM
jgi:hypothetical protein